MNRVVLDTNVFLRILLNDIPEQVKQAERILQQGKTGRRILIVPQAVIFEIAFALEKIYYFPKENIIDRLSSILSSGYFQIQDSDIFKDTIEIYKQKNLSLVDCFLYAFSLKNKAELFTFDKNLQKFKE
ncbi:PIN domain-containing protein [Candidatus Daviesbacteria bacterium]|nr:PIN domain-containing protein [Candidatus Daviesbacteria bacterium]